MPEGYQVRRETRDKEKKQGYWDAAMGLQQVDGIKPTQYLLSLAAENVAGQLSYQQIEALLYQKYENETAEDIENRNKEADMVSARIAEILDGPGFPLQPISLSVIHRELFKDIYTHAGQFRTFNIYKEEPVLNGETVSYTDYKALKDTLAYDFETEKSKSYAGLTNEQVITRISNFTSSIWQSHPFMEGNTRTTAVFMEGYLNNIGFQVDNSMFKEHSQFFRNALVRANYADYGKGIDADDQYLRKFYKNLLLGEKEMLKNRNLILKEQFFHEQGQ